MKSFFIALLLGYVACAPSCKITGGKVFKFEATGKKWTNARTHCKTNKIIGVAGDLVIDDNASGAANNFIKQQENNIWLGGHDENAEGTWVWVNGKSIATSGNNKDSRWSSGEPNDLNGQDCLVGNYNSKNVWDDQGCSKVHKFICEYDVLVENVSDRYLKYYSNAMTFDGAKTQCETDGGLLVIADTEAINSFLGKKNEEIWIGAFEDAMEGQWKWTNGESVWKSSFVNWAPGQPSNSERIEHCAVLKQGQWDDKYCKENHAFYCQFEENDMC